MYIPESNFQQGKRHHIKIIVRLLVTLESIAFKNLLNVFNRGKFFKFLFFIIDSPHIILKKSNANTHVCSLRCSFVKFQEIFLLRITDDKKKKKS